MSTLLLLLRQVCALEESVDLKTDSIICLQTDEGSVCYIVVDKVDTILTIAAPVHA